MSAASEPGLGRRRQIRAVTLIVTAIAIAAVAMIGMTARAVISSAPCAGGHEHLTVAVSTGIAPAITTVARSFNNSAIVVGGRCVGVTVAAGDSATQTSQIDGQAPAQTMASADAWIPDSSLWVDVARTMPLGAERVRLTGKSVARSPLLLVTTAAVASRTHVFDTPPGWNVLLPPADGGPPASLGLSVDLPDPTGSAAGLATLLQIGRVLRGNPAARTAFTEFVVSAEPTESFDSGPALRQFVASTLPPFDRQAITVASEQAVLAYDQVEPAAPLAARYPTDPSPALGSPELDYPYVVTTSAPSLDRAAARFGAYLQTSYARAVIRYYGFRDAAGVPDTMPTATGLSAQPLQLASAPSASTVATGLQAWERLGLGFRDLTLIDVSPAMNQPAGHGPLTLEQELTQTAARGLALFPGSTQMGLWEIGGSASRPYRQLVPIGPLPAAFGVINRRTQLQQIIATLHPGTGSLALNDAILAAYQNVTASYAPAHANAVLVLTSGVDSAAGDMSLTSLLTRLKALYNPGKKVEIVIIMFGRHGDLAAMQQIAGATGGAAYQIGNPAEVGKIFIEALSQRMCDQGCAAP